MDSISYQFEVRRGATESLGVELSTQDIFTERVRLKAFAGGTVARWSLALPSGLVEKTTASGGGLARDEATGSLFFPMDAAFTAGLPADTPLRTILTITEPNGDVGVWLDGTVIARG